MTKNLIIYNDMLADIIVETTTKNLTESSSYYIGISGFVVDWWWVIILLAVIAYIVYTNKKWIKMYHRKRYIKFLIKMGKKIVSNRWNDLYAKGKYEDSSKEYNEADKNNSNSKINTDYFVSEEINNNFDICDSNNSDKNNDYSVNARQAKLVVDNKSTPDDLSEKTFNLENAQGEGEFFSIVLAQCDGKPYFNVPKKENQGEDADPYVNVDPGRRWGIISVFDGMGGAGARMYKHTNTGEEHTSAWWASRYVKKAVEDLISSCPSDENPISYLENNIKRAIVTKLNDEVINFPAANAPLLSKMMRKLPTTMALCTYFIDKEDIVVSCYWSGDSRIYMFDESKMYFLTKDDVDASDGDPFSPANMDLAMNNTICQDRDFRINKSTIKVPYSSNNPIVLIAATDGCFGYFNNPIEFEYTIRHCLDTSKEVDEWLSSIKESIIANIQQDDFSMALVEIGDDNFASFKEKLTSCLYNNDLFDNYYFWINENNRSKQEIIDEINKKEEERNKLKAKLAEIQLQTDSQNNEWYIKYKQTFEIVNSVEIVK